MSSDSHTRSVGDADDGGSRAGDAPIDADVGSYTIDTLAERFIADCRAGENPSVSKLAATHPHLADQIQRLFPTLKMLEQAADESATDSADFAISQDSETLAKQRAGKLERLGEYRIIREIGCGGMGIVYLAEHQTLRRQVALKVLPYSVSVGKQKQRFYREARAAAKLHHSNIVPVFDFGEDDGVPYYAMPFIDGFGVDQLIANARELEDLRGGGPGKSTANRANTEGSTIDSGGGGGSDEHAGAQLLERFFSDESFSRVFNHSSTSLTAASDRADSNDASNDSDDSEVVTPGPTTAGGPINAGSGGSKRSGSGSASSGRLMQSRWLRIADVARRVADALHYAHAQGVLHRDIKPSNLLLDRELNVWITDFGLAKSTDDLDLTATGDFVGSLRYLAPEAIRGQADVRSDVCGVGLVLYEMACLRPAFTGDNRRVLLEQIIHEGPPKVGQVRPDVPRDLQVIIHKSIDPDPNARYQTARELEQDLARFLADEPILARPTSGLHHVWRWAKRNRALAGSLATITLLLITGLIASSLAALRLSRMSVSLEQSLAAERAATEEAETALRGSEVAFDYLVDVFRRPDPEADGHKVTVASVLDRAVNSVDETLAADPVNRDQLLAAIGQTYEGLGLENDAVEVTRRVLASTTDRYGDDSVEAARVRVDLARRLNMLSQNSEAMELITKAMNTFEATETNRPGDTATKEAGVDLCRARTVYGACLAAAGKLSEAVELLIANRANCQAVDGTESLLALNNTNQLAATYEKLGRYTDQKAVLEEALPIATATLGNRHELALAMADSLQSLRRLDGEPAGALVRRSESNWEVQREKLGADHPDTLATQVNLVQVLHDNGRVVRAVELGEQTLAQLHAVVGVQDERTISMHAVLGDVYQEATRLGDAVAHFQKAWDGYRELRGEEHPATLEVLASLSYAVTSVDPIKGKQLCEQALPRLKNVFGEENTNTIRCRVGLARAKSMLGQLDESTSELQELIGIVRESPDFGAIEAAGLSTMLATNLYRMERYDEALPAFQASAQMYASVLGDSAAATISERQRIARTLEQLGRVEEAVTLNEQALQGMIEAMGAASLRTAKSRAFLANSYLWVERYSDAATVCRDWIEAQSEVEQTADPRALPSIWLAEALYALGKFDEARDAVAVAEAAVEREPERSANDVDLLPRLAIVDGLLKLEALSESATIEEHSAVQRKIEEADQALMDDLSKIKSYRRWIVASRAKHLPD